MNIVGSFYWKEENETINYMIIDKDTLDIKKMPESILVKNDEQNVHKKIEEFIDKLSNCDNEVSLEYRTLIEKGSPDATKITHEIDNTLLISCKAHQNVKCGEQLQNFLKNPRKEAKVKNARTRFKSVIDELYKEKGYHYKLDKEIELRLWELAFHVIPCKLDTKIKEIKAKIH